MNDAFTYFDNNATTMIAPEALEAMCHAYQVNYGNPSSTHLLGIRAERALKQARESIANLCGMEANQVIFTSGGTESINLAIQGSLKRHNIAGSQVLTSPLEHESVLSCLKSLTSQGLSLKFAKVNSQGQLAIDSLFDQLRPETSMVVLMHVNNELGTIYPIEQIAKEIKQYNPAIQVVCDGAQAFGKLSLNLTHIDAYTISGHKLHGPKGTGALIHKNPNQLNPLVHGGGQEHNKRSGTQNVAGIIGLSKAAATAYAYVNETASLWQALKTQLIASLSTLEGVHINSPQDGLPNTINLAFPGVPAAFLMNTLEQEGFLVSTGAACQAGKKGGSHVLRAIGLPKNIIDSSLRVSFGRYNTQNEVSRFSQALRSIVPQLTRVTS